MNQEQSYQTLLYQSEKELLCKLLHNYPYYSLLTTLMELLCKIVHNYLYYSLLTLLEPL